MQPARAHAKVERAMTGRGWVRSQIMALSGLALMAAVIYTFVSLATWSIDDPSLSNASSNVPRNAGGHVGAILSDLLMQFTGLASVIALVPPTLWSWSRIRRRDIGRIRMRLVAWIIGVLCAAASLGAYGRTDSWPLPTGLGGVCGDLVLKLPALVLGGYPTGLYGLALCLFFALPATLFTLYAAGLLLRGARVEDSPYYDVQTGEILEEAPDNGVGLFFGAAAHLYYRLRMRFRRRGGAETQHREKPRSRGMIRALHLRLSRLLSPPDDGLEDFALASRRAVPEDPELGDELSGDYLRAPELAPDYGENIYPEPAIGQAEGRKGPQAEKVIQPMRTRLQPGKRQMREAQPGLLPGEDFELPHLDFLSEPRARKQDSNLSADALAQNARLLEGVLEDFGVKGEIINVRPGPVVTLYELEPAPGIKSSRVIGLADDIARSMSAIACRVAVVPGRNAIGIELPNSNRETVYLRELLASKEYETTKARLALVLGKTIGGEPVIADLAKMPHLLVAGTTGSGKSVAINTMILSILYRLTPDQVKLIMIDPKMLELSIYDGIPHLLTPVVTDPKKAVVALKWTVREMEDRYRKMSKLGVRNIDGYNTRLEKARAQNERLTRTVQTGFDRETGEAIYETEELDLEPMAYIVVIIDEMADLMMVAGKDIEGAVQRLAQMARAAGIHVIMATQRPSVDVITGTIKANFPTRISFQVTSRIDSRTILGEQGAEQLLGMGDMLYMAGGGRIKRVHGPFVADDEVEKVVGHLKEQGTPQYLTAVTEEDEDDAAQSDPLSPGSAGEPGDLYDQAVAIVLRDRKVSTSYVQRRLGIGYNRAASLIERMENEGVIGPANHAGKREILVPGEDETL